MTEPTPRQVLYALVAAGFLAVVGILIVGASMAGIVPGWWTSVAGIIWVATTAYCAARWRRTSQVLGLSIVLFAVWVGVTLLVANA